MSVDGKWHIRKRSKGSSEFPWFFTWTGEDCAAGGHYGSTETFQHALECVATEWVEHLVEEPPLIGPDGLRVPCQYPRCDRRSEHRSRCARHVGLPFPSNRQVAS